MGEGRHRTAARQLRDVKIRSVSFEALLLFAAAWAFLEGETGALLGTASLIILIIGLSGAVTEYFREQNQEEGHSRARSVGAFLTTFLAVLFLIPIWMIFVYIPLSAKHAPDLEKEKQEFTSFSFEEVSEIQENFLGILVRGEREWEGQAVLMEYYASPVPAMRDSFRQEKERDMEEARRREEGEAVVVYYRVDNRQGEGACLLTSGEEQLFLRFFSSSADETIITQALSSFQS